MNTPAPATPRKPVFVHDGHCPICEEPVQFTALYMWFRDHLICPRCRSIPRERALFATMALLYPDWKGLAIHESSPVNRGASARLKRDTANYVATQYDPDMIEGSFDKTRGFRIENLERQTFADQSFDLVITQDVFEHIFRPDLAIAEIARTLKPGGAHVLTTPITRKHQPSVRRAAFEHGVVVHRAEPIYHGNPMSKSGALVTVDWGYDILSYLAHHSGLAIAMHVIDNIDKGIRAEFIEVIVCKKAEGSPEI